jgi:anthranilate phosphoribosyltransferase
MNAGFFKDILKELAAGRALGLADAHQAFDLIMAGQVPPSQIAAFLMALRIRGESVDEIAAGALALRAKALQVRAPENAIDIVGTGGDERATLNISTAAALVAAGAGQPVAKHGNRAASSKCGSADVLAALGVNLDCELKAIEAALAKAQIAFLMAPRHHPAMRHVAPVRAELGIRTIFNLLGPLANPAGVKRLLIGVYERRLAEPLAEVMRKLGAERVWVVHGVDGLDELSITGPSFVAALDKGVITRFEVTPEEAGLARASLAELKGADAATNALAVNALLDGHKGAYRDIVVLNAAAALVIAGKAPDLGSGARLAEEAIDTRRARQALDKLIAITNEAPVHP